MNQTPSRREWRPIPELICMVMVAISISACHQRLASQPQQTSQSITFSDKRPELERQVRQFIPVGMPISECIHFFEANGFNYSYPARDLHDRDERTIPGEVLLAYKNQKTDSRWVTAFLRVTIEVVDEKAGDLRAHINYTGP